MNIQDMWLQAQLQKQGGMPMPSNNPALLSAMQKHPAPHHEGNPLNEGARAAMGSAREAIAERPKGMMGGVLDSVGKTLQNLSIARLRGSHRAPTAIFGNMMQTPGEMEEAQYKKNKDMMDFLSKQAMVQDATQHRNAVLAEQRRYHDIIASQRAQKLAVRGGASLHSPKMTGAERNIHAKALHGAKEAHGLILKSIKNLDALEKLNEGNSIDPTGSIIPGANSIMNSRTTSRGRKSYGLTNILNSDFSKLEILLERTLKGGVPDAQTIKRLHEEQVYPGIGQPTELNRKKLMEALKEVEDKISSSKFVLETGQYPEEVEESIGEKIPEQAAAPEQDKMAAIIAKVKAVNPNLSEQAILQAARNLSGK